MPVHGDPDFLAALRMNEQPMATLAGALLDEAGRLQLADDFIPSHCCNTNLSLGLYQPVLPHASEGASDVPLDSIAAIARVTRDIRIAEVVADGRRGPKKPQPILARARDSSMRQRALAIVWL
jgi:hypothetical protein